MEALILTVITALIPFAIKLLGLFIDKKVNNVELKRKFYDLVDTLNKSGYANIPAKLKKSYDDQSARLDEMERQEKENK